MEVSGDPGARGQVNFSCRRLLLGGLERWRREEKGEEEGLEGQGQARQGPGETRQDKTDGACRAGQQSYMIILLHYPYIHSSVVLT